MKKFVTAYVLTFTFMATTFLGGHFGAMYRREYFPFYEHPLVHEIFGVLILVGYFALVIAAWYRALKKSNGWFE